MSEEPQSNGYVLWLECLQEQPDADDAKKDTNEVENGAGEITESSKKDEGLKDTVSNSLNGRVLESYFFGSSDGVFYVDV